MLCSMIGAMALVAMMAGAALAQLVNKTVLTLDGAKKIAAAAEAKAKAEGARVVIAVVDDGAACCCWSVSMTRKWPASMSGSTRRGPRRSIAGRARSSKTRSAAAASRPWLCTERSHCRAGCPSLSEGKSLGLSASAEKRRVRMRASPWQEPWSRRHSRNSSRRLSAIGSQPCIVRSKPTADG